MEFKDLNNCLTYTLPFGINYAKHLILTVILFFNFNLYASHGEEILRHKNFKVNVTNEHLSALNTASTLLISCVDFRLRSETNELMGQLNLLEDYDEVSLPGASLALVNSKYPYWGKTIEDVIGILQDLHHIKQVVFLDHRECGAYKLLMSKEYTATREKETKIHTETLNKARKLVKHKFPTLRVYTFLMGLDGVVEQIHDND